MSAQIVIDDGTNPPVIGSVDLDNSFLATAFTLSNFDNTNILAHRWTLKDKPIGSSAVLTSGTTPTTQFTPDIAGGYLVELTTYLDAGATDIDDTDVQEVGVRFGGGFPWLVPAAGETIQQDASRGWATSREEAIRDVHSFMNGGIPVLTGAVNEILDGADPETVLGGFVLDGSNFPNNALKLRLLGVLTVAGAGTGDLRLYDMGLVGSGAAAGILRSTATIPNGSAGQIIVIDTALTPAAAPGVDADEVITARHRYELRAQLVGGAGGDTLKIHQGAVVLEG
jgi:hypothetical protein